MSATMTMNPSVAPAPRTRERVVLSSEPEEEKALAKKAFWAKIASIGLTALLMVCAFFCGFVGWALAFYGLNTISVVSGAFVLAAPIVAGVVIGMKDGALARLQDENTQLHAIIDSSQTFADMTQTVKQFMGSAPDTAPAPAK